MSAGKEGTVEAPSRIEPEADWESGPYWEAAARGVLLIKRCRACGRAHWYPRAHCPHCQADEVEWEAASGRGTVYSHTTVHQNSGRAFRDWVPYRIGLVELEEGPRVFAFLRGPDAALGVGAPVTVGFESVGSTALPVFLAAEGGQA